MPLSEEQISIFLNDGVLVVDNVLTDSQLQDSLIGLSETLAQHGVDTNALEGTGCNLALLSSTGGSGGVLDIAYYDEWKINNIASNPNLFAITKQLWHAAYNCIHGKNNGEILEKMDDNWRVHPYGNFDCEKGYMYIDRVGYRLPSDLAEKLGELNAARNHCMQNCPQNASKINATPAKHGKSKKRKSRSIQRSLTPHLDCCPDDFSSLQGKTKWRPIQCFVSLVDTVFPNHGGFEAAKGFHIDFARWSCNRPPAIIAEKNIGKNNQQPNDLKLIPAPCVGEYTHIRPKEDADVMSRIRHIPVKAGAAVFWDNR